MGATKQDAGKPEPGRPSTDRQPESLATFAEAARGGTGKKPDDIGLTATAATKPLRADPRREADAATRIMNGNATGRDEGGEAAADALPDRTRTKKR